MSTISQKDAKGRPNIILIITDEQRLDTINALGYPYMQTPNLDKLASEGMSFTNCYTMGASCAPARASLFSGMFPCNTGVRKNGDTWKYCWVEELAKSGYHTVNIGKMHTYPYEESYGFDERFVVENKDRYMEGRYFFDRWDMFLQGQGLIKQQRELYRQRPDYKDALGAFDWELPEHTQSDMFVGDFTKWWIDHKPKYEEPLFLEIGFPGPHPPFDPPKRYSDMYKDTEIPLPNLPENYVETMTPFLQNLRQSNIDVDHDSLLWVENPTDEQLRKMRQYYYANVTMIDEKIGEILQCLEAKGYLDNAIVIFTSDHGDSMGDHANVEKFCMFDEIVKVPMVVWASDDRFQKGVVTDQLCQTFDIAPVIMQAAGLEIPSTWETKDLTPVLTGECTDEFRDYVYCEQCADSDRCTSVRNLTMVRNKEWKLVHYLGDDVNGELYDLVSDPEEHYNLWYDEKYLTVKHKMIFECLKFKCNSQYDTMSRK